MKLLTKFNLILLLLFGAASFIISEVAYSFLINNARREVMQEAELMMASATSVRDYTAENLRPLLERTPGAQDEISARDSPCVRSDQHIQTVFPEEISGLLLSRSFAESNQSGRPSHRLGGRRHLVPARSFHGKTGFGRSRNGDGAGALSCLPYPRQ